MSQFSSVLQRVAAGGSRTEDFAVVGAAVGVDYCWVEGWGAGVEGSDVYCELLETGFGFEEVLTDSVEFDDGGGGFEVHRYGLEGVHLVQDVEEGDVLSFVYDVLCVSWEEEDKVAKKFVSILLISVQKSLMLVYPWRGLPDTASNDLIVSVFLLIFDWIPQQSISIERRQCDSHHVRTSNAKGPSIRV